MQRTGILKENSCLKSMIGKVLTVANGITLFRVMLFGGFVWMLFLQDLPKAIFLFALTWALDAVDGWVARFFNQASSFGEQFDKWVDRFLIGFGLLFLIRTEFLSPEALLILTKDFALLPAATFHGMRNESFKEVGLPGKIMTFVQGGSILWLLSDWPHAGFLVVIVGLLGGGVAWYHLRKIHQLE